MRLDLRYDDSAAREAFRKAPAIVLKRLEAGLELGAIEFAREARANLASRNGFGALLQSVMHRRVGELHFEVSPGVKYGEIVEGGSGPAAGRAKYYPNPDALKAWLMTNPTYRGHAWAKPGSAKRSSQALDIWFRSRAMAWGIYQKGTKAYPFMQPAFDAKKARVGELATAAIRAAVAEINGGSNAA